MMRQTLVFIAMWSCLSLTLAQITVPPLSAPQLTVPCDDKLVARKVVSLYDDTMDLTLTFTIGVFITEQLNGGSARWAIEAYPNNDNNRPIKVLAQGDAGQLQRIGSNGPTVPLQLAQFNLRDVNTAWPPDVIIVGLPIAGRFVICQGELFNSNGSLMFSLDLANMRMSQIRGNRIIGIQPIGLSMQYVTCTAPYNSIGGFCRISY